MNYNNKLSCNKGLLAVRAGRCLSQCFLSSNILLLLLFPSDDISPHRQHHCYLTGSRTTNRRGWNGGSWSEDGDMRCQLGVFLTVSKWFRKESQWEGGEGRGSTESRVTFSGYFCQNNVLGAWQPFWTFPRWNLIGELPPLGLIKSSLIRAIYNQGNLCFQVTFPEQIDKIQV